MPETSLRVGYLAGASVDATERLDVIGPEDGRTLAEIGLADAAQIERAVQAAAACRAEIAAEPAHARSARLHHLADALAADAAGFARTLAEEAGKPIRFATGEVDRAVQTLRLAAEEAVRVHGEYLPLDGTPKGAGRRGLVKRVPRGVCAFITPFNFPLNLVAHKIAPALAVGCPWVLKPAEKTPLTALRLGGLLAKVEPALPAGAWSILPAMPEQCGPLTDSPEVATLSFTGSAAVGWKLKARAAHARVLLELGGNAPAILCDDWDLEHALDRCALGAFAYSGQVCISLQRLFVPADRLEETTAGLARRAAGLRRGPLLEKETEIGPLITEDAAGRVADWIDAAVASGATLHCGGQRDVRFVAPAVLSGVDPEQQLWCEEVFGPVLAVEPYDSFDDALARADRGPYGLQAGLFTHDWRRIERAWDRLEVGQLIVGDSPVFRVDSMPYGGVKRSGSGREGVRYAIDELTEPRLLVL